MGFDWKALIALGRTLIEQADSVPDAEAHLRTAVNRAYFGAFGHAFLYAVAYLRYDPKESPEEHGRLRDHLRRSRRKGVADRLSQLRQWRNEADYASELPWANVLHTAALALDQAGPGCGRIAASHGFVTPEARAPHVRP